jgi:hypothetical protein
VEINYQIVVMRSLIHSLPTSPATLATPQFAAVIVGCDRTLENEEKRSLIHALPTSLVMLATFQSEKCNCWMRSRLAR